MLSIKAAPYLPHYINITASCGKPQPKPEETHIEAMPFSMVFPRAK
jgi:hypothetical protein